MTQHNQPRQRKSWSEIGHAILNAIETVLDIGVDHAPKIGKKVGKFVVAVFDVVAGAFTLTYIFNQLTPPEFLVIAKIFAWAISAATYFFVNDLFEGAQEDAYKVIFAWGLNLVDALFIDAGGVFILFGQAGFVSGNWEKFISAVFGMPIFGWALYIVVAGLSLWAEWYRTSGAKPAHGSHSQPNTPAPQPQQQSTFRPAPQPQPQGQTFRPAPQPQPQGQTFRPAPQPQPQGQTFRPAPQPQPQPQPRTAPRPAGPTEPTYHPISFQPGGSQGSDHHDA